MTIDEAPIGRRHVATGEKPVERGTRKTRQPHRGEGWEACTTLRRTSVDPGLHDCARLFPRVALRSASRRTSLHPWLRALTPQGSTLSTHAKPRDGCWPDSRGPHPRHRCAEAAHAAGAVPPRPERAGRARLWFPVQDPVLSCAAWRHVV